MDTSIFRYVLEVEKIQKHYPGGEATVYLATGTDQTAE